VTDKQVVERIEVRLAELTSYNNGLNYDPTDTRIPPERRTAIDEDQKKTKARIDELERLKKIIYTS